MSRKHTVLRDELNIKGGGIYCYLPFERLDQYKKAVFKIGLAIDFNNRTEQYHTYFPLGVYMVAFLVNPPIPRKTRTQDEKPTRAHYQVIERFILDYIENNGGKRVYSTTRIKNPNLKKEGETEWIYTDEQTIQQAFKEAQKKFNGKLDLFNLEGKDKDTNQSYSINETARARENQKPNYVGKIIFHI